MTRRTTVRLAYSILLLAVLLGVLGSVLMLLNDHFPPPAVGRLLSGVFLCLDL